MNFFDGADYRFNKFLLSLTGLWPHDSAFKTNTTLLIFLLIAGSQMIAKITGLIGAYTDTNLFIESLPPIIVDAIGLIKMCTCIAKTKQIKALLGQMKSDWCTLKVYKEIAVLRRYTDGGRRLAQMYTILLYAAMMLFMLLPFAPRILHITNDSILLHNTEYYVDVDTYYYPILVHSCVEIIMCITIYVAADAIFIVFIQHACGMFATIGYRLEHMTKDDSIHVDMSPSMKDDDSYKNVSGCIQIHINVLRFANLLESSYNICFLLQAGLNMILMSITSVQAVTNLSNPHELFRQTIFTYAQLFHLAFESYQAQQLTDHSARIHEHIINSTWYLTSSRTKKLINLMILRSQTPCILTAGKLYVISMETCSAIVRMSMSYFMMLRTFQ